MSHDVTTTIRAMAAAIAEGQIDAALLLADALEEAGHILVAAQVRTRHLCWQLQVRHADFRLRRDVLQLIDGLPP